MVSPETLIIGGSGLLGGHIELAGPVISSNRSELNLLVPKTIEEYFLQLFKGDKQIAKIIILAAYTNVAKSNIERDIVYQTNVIGLRSIITAARKYYPSAIVTFISTDYVFDGKRGMYRWDEPICPVAHNYYAFTKAVGEEIVSTARNYQIIRTSFCKSNSWPYTHAFTDQFTSRDKVEIIAPKIANIINMEGPGIYHVGTERKSVYQLALNISNGVLPTSRMTIRDVELPHDTSLELNTI